MINAICLWVGRVIVGIFIIALLCLLWTKFLRYFFYKFKHLFPWWQFSGNLIEEWRTVIKNAEPEDWRSKVTLTQKGRFVILRIPSGHFGNRVNYVLVKKT